MGISAQQLLQSDPAYLQRQLAQQEMQRLNPTGSAAGAIGALLGRGVSNVAGGRGFFDVNDAGLRRVADVQKIMSSAQFNPEDPASYYETIAKSLQAAGYGDLAPMAAQEAAKFRKEAKIDQRAERALVVTEESAKDAKYKNNPELLLRDALALPEEDPTRTALLTRYSDIVKDKNYSTAKQEADLAKAKADLARTQAETTRIQALAAREGEIGVLGKPGPIGKLGGYRDVNGQIYAPTEIAKQRAAFEALGTMLDKTNNITAQDIKNAESIFDYTQETGIIKGAAAKVSEKTVDAQTRLAAVQLLQQIDSLPPGSASDADMKAAKAAFPGYGSSRNLLRWINDTKTTLSKNYNDQADKFGFTKKVKTTPLLSFDKEKGTAQDEWAVIGVQK
jgi:hypothetical protein